MCSKERLPMDKKRFQEKVLSILEDANIGASEKLVLVAWSRYDGNVSSEIIAKASGLSPEEAKLTVDALIKQGEIPLRQCTGPCGRSLPPTTEYFHTKGEGRLKAQCKDCFNSYHRSFYRKSHPEAEGEENNRSKARKAMWASKTPEQKQEIFAKSRIKMAESAKERWANPEEVQAVSQKTKGHWDSLSPEERAERGKKVLEGKRKKKLADSETDEERA